MPVDSGPVWIGGLLAFGAVLLATLFEYFHQIHGHRHLRLWGASWLAAGVHVALDMPAALGGPSLSPVGQGIGVFAGYAHMGFLVWGVYEASTGRRAGPGLTRLSAGAIVVLSFAGFAAFSLGSVPLTSEILYLALTGLAYLAAAALLFRKRGVWGLGSQVVAAGFVLHGVVQFFWYYVDSRPDPSAGLVPVAALVQLLAEFQLALGLVIWLLEQVRDRAVTATRDFHLAQEASLRRFRRLLEKGWDLVELRQRDGSVDWVSQSVERVLGVGVVEYRSTAPLESVHPDDRPAMGRLLSGQCVSQHPARIRMLGADGRYRQLESLCVDLTGDPVVEALVVTSRDVTDRYALQKELLEASGRERRELGRDLHDGLGQLLTGIGFRVAQLEGTLTRGGADALELAAEIKGLVKSAITQADVLARGLSPVSMQASGIVSALESLADSLRKRYGAICTVEGVDVRIHDPEVANQIFMIAQEASLSAVKIHGSSALKVGITRSRDGGVLYVRANRPRRTEGGGEARRATMADRILHHRASVIDASLDIVEADDFGHAIVCRFHRGGVEALDLSEAG